MHSCGSWTLALLVILAFSGPVSGGASSEGMHVVWIIADDMGPQLGCYGTPGVRTPNLDRLAAEGMRFTNAFSSAPVCSSSRSAIITGVHQSAINAHQHRTISKPPLPDGIAPLPVILAEAGVSSFNGNFNLGKPGKRDYNFAWSGPALYAGNDWATGAREDPDDRQRFFQQVQIFEPHRRFRKNTVPAREMVLEVPSWLPDTPLVRADEAGYLESIEVLDRKVGRILQRIDTAGETERTVVIFLGDHGRPQVRSKQWLYNAGLHVPLIIRWPGVVPAGVLNEELVCLVDLAPTTLAVMGVDVPDWMHGRVLVGPDREPPVDVVCAARDRCDETLDTIRCARTNHYTYIRNLTPSTPWMQPNAYKERQYPLRSLLRVMHDDGALEGPSSVWMAPERPSEELYDRRNDPDELVNLANDPAHQDALLRMREHLDRWMSACGDPGAIQEDPQDLQAAATRASQARQRTRQQLGFDPLEDPRAMVAREEARLVKEQEDGWRWLMTPGSMEGWHALPGGTWTWEGDVIVGRSPRSESRHGLLVSDLEFDDFEVTFEFRAVTGCSGFYFRAREIAGQVGVAGFQAEVEPNFEAGGLYETRGRAWVSRPSPRLIRSIYTPGEWATMRIVARGGDVDVFLNGVRTASLRDDPGRLKGRFGLQLHGGQDLHVEFRNLRIRPVK